MAGFIFNLVDTHAKNYRLVAIYKENFIKEWLNDGENTVPLFERFHDEFSARIMEDGVDSAQLSTMCTYNICQFMTICISKGIREEDINNELLKDYYDLDNALTDVDMLEKAKTICFKMIDFTRGNQKNVPVSKAINECIKYIDEHILSSLNLERISKSLNYSSDYLSHKFNMEMHVGINEYISIKKIEYAKQELSKGKTVNDVANELSYSSASYFIKSFKKITGLTPKQYQKWILKI